MQSIAVIVLAFAAAASAGGLISGPGYYASPAYAPAVATYAHAAPVYSTPVVAKTVVPAAQSYAYTNRAPAALAVAAPAVYAAPAYAHGPAYAHAPLAVAAPAYASTYSVRAPKAFAVGAPAVAAYGPAYAGYGAPAFGAAYASPAYHY